MFIHVNYSWSRYRNIEKLNTIEGGHTVFLVDNLKLDGKMSQNLEDSKKATFYRKTYTHVALALLAFAFLEYVFIGNIGTQYNRPEKNLHSSLTTVVVIQKQNVIVFSLHFS